MLWLIDQNGKLFSQVGQSEWIAQNYDVKDITFYEEVDQITYLNVYGQEFELTSLREKIYLKNAT